MGATTYTGRVLRALQFKTNNELWGAIGRTTAWDNEADPPDDPVSATTIEEPIVYVKAALVTLSKIVSTDAHIIINSQGYAYVDDEDAYDEDARFLIVDVMFDPVVEQVYGNFRQIGLFANLTPTTGHESDDFLIPADVSDEGVLVYVHNDTVTTMAADRQEEVKIALEFR
jgi:hypothetical protein